MALSASVRTDRLRHESFSTFQTPSQIERFNNTLRQRCSRLVRKGLSFSKNFFNHEGAILYLIHHYNRELLLN